MRPEAFDLPAFKIAAELNGVLADATCAVVTAPPGAGKSTLLPLTMLEGLPEGKILMLEPRRIAARQIAERMAFLLGESVGQTVGYRIRFEKKVSRSTRIEVLTEGILTRMLVEDPTLDGVAAVIFDEFHERSLIGDVALSLTRESQQLIRPDLKVVVMSATIDADGICRELDAPLVESEGRMFPVETIHSSETSQETVASDVARCITLACKEHDGDVLAFLPGEGEIRRCAEILGEPSDGSKVYPLYGLLSQSEQKAAIAPSLPGERKIVLATPIAETSITIEGVRIVVDSGLCRKMVFNAQSGLSRLETVRISMDMARQRTGRAGRVAAGVCYRLWSVATESRMADCRTPEILEADLAPTVLDIAAWGESRPERLPWLTPPPPGRVRLAQQTLESLGAVTSEGTITQHGRKMAALPCHPRISQMLLHASTPQQKSLAADLAAILEEKDPLAGSSGADICLRVEQLRRSRGSRTWSRISRIAEQYMDMAGVGQDDSVPDPYEAGVLLAAAYPERIAKSIDAVGRFMLSSGEPAAVEHSDPIASSEWIAIASLNSRPGSDGRIFLAAPLSENDLKPLATQRDNVSWDSRRGGVVAQREWRIGTLLLDARQLSDIPRSLVDSVICKAAAKEGLSMLDFAAEDVGNLQRRVACVACWHPELELPDISTEAVLACAEEWLPAYIGKASNIAELKKIRIYDALWGMLAYEQQQAVERFAPSHIAVPTGSKIRVEYRQGAELPVLRVRLQECFGLVDTPRVDGGRLPVLMELLSPGYKPVQLTQDLHSFWEGTYFEVRKELRRRYPKHSWPDKPLEAEAIRGIRKTK